jgi:hypothetical protein
MAPLGGKSHVDDGKQVVGNVTVDGIDGIGKRLERETLLIGRRDTAQGIREIVCDREVTTGRLRGYNHIGRTGVLHGIEAMTDDEVLLTLGIQIERDGLAGVRTVVETGP